MMLRSVFLAITLSLSLTNAAIAAATTYVFQAAVSLETRNGFSATPDQRFFVDGDLIMGSFSYDPDVGGGVPGPSAGTFYPFPSLTDLSGTIAGNSFSDPGGIVGVFNNSFDSNPGDPTSPLVDFLIMLAVTQNSPSGLSGFQVVNGATVFELVNVRLFWIAGASDFFDDEALPQTLPPGSGGTARIALDFQDMNDPGNIHRVFGDPLVVSAVPVPAAIWLFPGAISLLGWVGVRKGKRRRS